MKWNRYDIFTTTEACDLICSELADLGITSVEIRDNLAQPREILGGMYVDIPLDIPEDNGDAVISFYLEEGKTEDLNALISDVKERIRSLSAFVDTGYGKIEESVTEDEDWVNNWKQFWHTFKVNDLYIKPSWEEVTPEMTEGKILSLDPGTAFGTGAHETTRLVINIIQKIIKAGDKVLDIGCGSGILSLVSCLYGASYVFGADLDDAAIEESYSNVRLNNIPTEKTDFFNGNLIEDNTFQNKCGYNRYDLVYANILPDVLVPLSPVVSRFMKTGSYLIYSGILKFKEEEVRKALEAAPELSIIDTVYDGDWVAILARKN